MNKLFYPKLAAQNIRKNAKTYIPFILTCIFTTAMFFIVLTVSCIKWANSDSLATIMSLGTAVIGIFSAIFLYYTNSFLIKRRKKEFGIFNILGMEKQHIANILVFESLYVYIFSTAFGLGFGALFSKLVFKLLVKILDFGENIEFVFYNSSVMVTLGVFGLIAMMNLFHNLFSIHLAKPIELLKGSNVGEKEPKAKVFTAILGVISLAAGYIIAQTVQSPLVAVGLFFIAVLLVIIGTFLLFSSGSIWLLKALKKNKKYYYKTKHFTSVSSMMYRMKQNAAGLASICILSTAVLVTVSTTVSLFAGSEDVLRTRYPRNIMVQCKGYTAQQAQESVNAIQNEAEKAGVQQNNILYYRSLEFSAIQEGNNFASGASADDYTATNNAAILVFLPLDDYNRLMGTNETLEKSEVLLYAAHSEQLENTIAFCGNEFTVKGRVQSLQTLDSSMAYMINYFYIIVPDEQTALDVYSAYGYENREDVMQSFLFRYGFDTEADAETEMALSRAISDVVHTNARVECAELSRDNMNQLYGGLFFIGITLGLLFLVATVLIIYYKQVSEGYDDRERFNIMQKVGMSKKEVKSAIHSQVLTMFFLPLATAVIHICFGFKVITKLLAVLNLQNIVLFFWCTIATVIVFAIIYALVYSLTAKAYYKIVEEK